MGLPREVIDWLAKKWEAKDHTNDFLKEWEHCGMRGCFTLLSQTKRQYGRGTH